MKYILRIITQKQPPNINAIPHAHQITPTPVNFSITLDFTPLRNVRLSNVLVDKQGYPKLSDFGRSRYSISYNGEETKGSQDLEGMINVQYMAPEVFGSTGHDRMADYWSLGVCIQYMLTGKVAGRVVESDAVHFLCLKKVK